MVEFYYRGKHFKKGKLKNMPAIYFLKLKVGLKSYYKFFVCIIHIKIFKYAIYGVT
jgi:hypothetical protein